MSSTYEHAGVFITRKIGPAKVGPGGRLVAFDGGNPRLVELWAENAGDPVTVTPAEAIEIGTQLIAAAGAIGGWKGE